ncbi:hypothetical protein [Fulvivirga ligni]|uniref:hypothetical protein n=1 Tax=Fulvivirga ligni TaxID=2904246 RepID=UPI001F182B93|nr:hypothetical protein [Fulvivirga ligni]UII19273.1 hypothetical protein LVD16_15620 [Fulvivirga ligni]
MKRYNIELYKSFDKTTFYTIHEESKKVSETDDFFLRFKDEKKFQRDVNLIRYWLGKIGNEYGAQERRFRPEGKGSAIPIESSKLRLYCYRINERIIILGNGGEKTSQKVQDSPDAFPHFETINHLAYIINLKKQKGEISFAENQIQGDLSFYIK